MEWPTLGSLVKMSMPRRSVRWTWWKDWDIHGAGSPLPFPNRKNMKGLEDLQGKRIATSYPVILENYLQEHGVKADIHVLSGSVELAPSIGMADAIFDIVSSGSTLISNGLKEVEVIMKSEAVIIANRNLDEEIQRCWTI